MKSSKNPENVRGKMEEREPKLVQPIITAITGVAGPNEVEFFRHTSGSRAAIALGQFGLGVAGGMALVHFGGFGLLGVPLTTLMAAGAARSAQTTFEHQASHGTVSKNKRLNDLVGEAASILAWLQPLEDYREGHIVHHAKLATSDDPDLQFVRDKDEDKLGFEPGKTRAEYWSHLRQLLISPRFHLSRTLTRLWVNLIKAKGLRRLASWIYGLGLAGFVAWSGLYLEFLIAYILPVIIMHNMAAVLQTVSEHSWVFLGHGQDPRKRVVLRLTWERYMGQEHPAEGTGWIERVVWWTKMILIHWPLRIWVVPLDLTSHALHHLLPTKFDWPRAPFARRELQALMEKEGIAHQEVWGLKQALDLTFDHMRLVPPNAVLGEPKNYGWIDPELLQM